MMKKRYKVLVGLFAILLIITGGLAIWLFNPYEPKYDAVEVMGSNNAVNITDEGWYVFDPSGLDSKTGFIFYPGGRVDAKAYAPLAYNIAKSGYKVIIVPMPVNLAVLGINKADDIIETYQEINKWLIGGHSLGGAMAARYAHKNLENLAGLILLASYPDVSDNLSSADLNVLSIYATKDGFATVDKIKNTKHLLPEDTYWKEINGGNHSQFGYYGFQSGDNKADISRGKQQNIIVNTVIQFLSGL